MSLFGIKSTALREDQHVDGLEGPAAVHHPPEHADAVPVPAAVVEVGLRVDDVLLILPASNPSVKILVQLRVIAVLPHLVVVLPLSGLLSYADWIGVVEVGIVFVDQVDIRWIGVEVAVPSPPPVVFEHDVLKVKVPVDHVPRVGMEVAVHDGREARDQDGPDRVPKVRSRPRLGLRHPLEGELREVKLEVRIPGGAGDDVLPAILKLLHRLRVVDSPDEIAGLWVDETKRGHHGRVGRLLLEHHVVAGVVGDAAAQRELVLVHAVEHLVLVDPLPRVIGGQHPQDVLGHMALQDVLRTRMHLRPRDLPHTRHTLPMPRPVSLKYL